MAINLSKLPEHFFSLLAAEIDKHRSLSEVLAWAETKPKGDVHPHFVSEVITQDEFTHDVIVPYKEVFLVYDTT